MTTKLPEALTRTGASVAFIAMPVVAGTIAHRPASASRMVPSRHGYGQPVKETFDITACAASEGEHADEAYQLSAAWADHLGAVACTEPGCFPTP